MRVNAGRSDLPLGWEVFNVGGVRIPLSGYRVLKREGPLAPGGRDAATRRHAGVARRQPTVIR